MNNSHYGDWSHDCVGLPVFRFRKQLPCRDKDRDGKPAAYADDPYFMLGNDALNCFVRVSGTYSLVSGTYGWARLNAGDLPNSSVNHACLSVGDRHFDLLGIGAPISKREFGIGFARFATDDMGGLAVERLLACPPGPGNNEAAGLLTRIRLHNRSNIPLTIQYEEWIGVRYCLNTQQRKPASDRPVRYPVRVHSDKAHARASFQMLADNPVHVAMPSVTSPFHTCPPEVFVQLLPQAHPSQNQQVFAHLTSEEMARLGLRAAKVLQADEQVTFAWWTGFAHAGETVALPAPNSATANSVPFRSQWRRRIPEFCAEKNPSLRAELQWHVGVLEAMAQRSGPYGETFIPQGCSYDYDLGAVASERDLLQHGLACLYYRPALAKSILRHCMKKMTPTGEIRLIEENGLNTSHWFFFASDQQLYFLYLMAEYLRITGDSAILEESVHYYPPTSGAAADGLTRIEQALGFITHEVRTGENGLLRLLCSDWNDCVYFFLKDRAYPDIYQNAESTLNATMAVYVADNLVSQLSKIPSPDTARGTRIQNLILSLQLLANQQRAALAKIWQGRDFLPRVLLPDGETWGGDDLFLEPQVFALLDKSMPDDAKISLWHTIRASVLNGEQLGARQRQCPPDYHHYKSGNRENGGVWYALNGPLIVALADFAHDDAWNLLRRNTLAHHADAFPDQWPGIWSSSDNLESSLRATAGMPDPCSIWSDMPIYCAHPHAWIITAWHELRLANDPASMLQ